MCVCLPWKGCQRRKFNNLTCALNPGLSHPGIQNAFCGHLKRAGLRQHLCSLGCLPGRGGYFFLHVWSCRGRLVRARAKRVWTCPGNEFSIQVCIRITLDLLDQSLWGQVPESVAFKRSPVDSEAASGLKRACGGPVALPLPQHPHRQGMEKPLGSQLLLSPGCAAGLTDKATDSTHFRTTAMAARQAQGGRDGPAARGGLNVRLAPGLSADCTPRQPQLEELSPTLAARLAGLTRADRLPLLVTVELLF